MQRLTLEANYRTDMTKSRVKQIRRGGGATGTVFGRDAEAVPIEINVRSLVDAIKGSEAGMMSLIDMKIGGAPKGSDGTVIIKRVYKDPLTRKVLDIQFQRVSMEQTINVSVPIVLTGEAEGSREGGIVEQSLDNLDVNCLPGAIPSRIEVDISSLGIGQHITVGDLVVPDGVEVRVDPTLNVCACVAPHVSHVEEEAEEAGAEPAETTTESQAEPSA